MQLRFNETDGRYYDPEGTAYTVSEVCRKIYSQSLLAEMQAVRDAAYRAVEAGTLTPVQRDAIERVIGLARQQLMPAADFAAVLKSFRREIEREAQ